MRAGGVAIAADGADLLPSGDVLSLTEVRALLMADADRIHEVSFTDPGYAARLLTRCLADLLDALHGRVP